MKTVIDMAREAGIDEWWDSGSEWRETLDTHLERFAELVAGAEREKSLQLWMLLDDVDTADDIAKADDAIYRSLCRQAHQRRWHVLTGEEVDTAIRARGNV